MLTREEQKDFDVYENNYLELHDSPFDGNNKIYHKANDGNEVIEKSKAYSLWRKKV